MPAVTDFSQEECNIMWDHFVVQIIFSLEGRVSGDPPNLFLQSNHCCGDLFSLTLPEEEYTFMEVKAISSGRFSSKAMPHFSSSPRDTGTAWQCSFYQMPWQPRSLSLHQFWDPKLPFLVDWNPKEG